MDDLEWKSLLNWMVWGYHYFRKHTDGKVWNCQTWTSPRVFPSVSSLGPGRWQMFRMPWSISCRCSTGKGAGLNIKNDPPMCLKCVWIVVVFEIFFSKCVDGFLLFPLNCYTSTCWLYIYPSLKRTVRTWKWTPGSLEIPNLETPIFRCELLVSGRVTCTCILVYDVIWPGMTVIRCILPRCWPRRDTLTSFRASWKRPGRGCQRCEKT